MPPCVYYEVWGKRTKEGSYEFLKVYKVDEWHKAVKLAFRYREKDWFDIRVREFKITHEMILNDS